MLSVTILKLGHGVQETFVCNASTAIDSTPKHTSFTCCGSSGSSVLVQPADGSSYGHASNVNHKLALLAVLPTGCAQPLCQQHGVVSYTPSALGAVERGGVSISSSEIGTWEYACSGVGLPPTVMPEAIVAGIMGGQGSTTLTWRNPFSESAEVRASRNLTTTEPNHPFIQSV